MRILLASIRRSQKNDFGTSGPEFNRMVPYWVSRGMKSHPNASINAPTLNQLVNMDGFFLVFDPKAERR
jgi:hypothetical protein